MITTSKVMYFKIFKKIRRQILIFLKLISKLRRRRRLRSKRAGRIFAHLAHASPTFFKYFLNLSGMCVNICVCIRIYMFIYIIHMRLYIQYSYTSIHSYNLFYYGKCAWMYIKHINIYNNKKSFIYVCL